MTSNTSGICAPFVSKQVIIIYIWILLSDFLFRYMWLATCHPIKDWLTKTFLKSQHWLGYVMSLLLFGVPLFTFNNRNFIPCYLWDAIKGQCRFYAKLLSPLVWGIISKKQHIYPSTYHFYSVYDENTGTSYAAPNTPCQRNCENALDVSFPSSFILFSKLKFILIWLGLFLYSFSLRTYLPRSVWLQYDFIPFFISLFWWVTFAEGSGSWPEGPTFKFNATSSGVVVDVPCADSVFPTDPYQEWVAPDFEKCPSIMARKPNPKDDGINWLIDLIIIWFLVFSLFFFSLLLRFRFHCVIMLLIILPDLQCWIPCPGEYSFFEI